LAQVSAQAEPLKYTVSTLSPKLLVMVARQMLWTFALLALAVLTNAVGKQVSEFNTPDSKVHDIVKENQMLRNKLAHNDNKLKSVLGEAKQQEEKQPNKAQVSTTSQQQRSHKASMPQEEAKPAEKKVLNSNNQQEDSKPATMNTDKDEEITVGFPGEEVTVDFPKDECKKKCWHTKDSKGCEEQCDYSSSSKKGMHQKAPKVSMEDDGLGFPEDPMGLPGGIPGMPPQSMELLANDASSNMPAISSYVVAITSLGFLVAFVVHLQTRPTPIARPLLG